ncbi:MAG: ribosome recycling factor [Candidatus Adiutrix intracellularis]|jgi:ribosome recycling factor|nr:MAG: ribosome recycling factor [Candidatus Adiutrix intracellularis]MDR2826600.1 ribosome recycling factor [Candidatus Adiutrix intracellularis]
MSRVDDIYGDLMDRMGKAVLALGKSFIKIRTGRATPALLDGLVADYYGVPTPLTQMASVITPDPHLLMIQPWDAQAMGEIEKAILKSELGLTPQNDGKVIRIIIPILTQERRKDLLKLIKKNAEEGRVAIRNIRRDANEMLKDLKKNKEISEDDLSKAETKVQKMTDDFIRQAEVIVVTKEKEIMEF